MARMSFSYPDEYKQVFQDLAEADDRSVSAYIQKILKKHLKEKGVTVKMTKRNPVGRPVGSVTESTPEPTSGVVSEKAKPKRKKRTKK